MEICTENVKKKLSMIKTDKGANDKRKNRPLAAPFWLFERVCNSAARLERGAIYRLFRSAISRA